VSTEKSVKTIECQPKNLIEKLFSHFALQYATPCASLADV
jgi:hypothetical protein